MGIKITFGYFPIILPMDKKHSPQCHLYSPLLVPQAYVKLSGLFGTAVVGKPALEQRQNYYLAASVALFYCISF